MHVVGNRWKALKDAERKMYNDRSAALKVTALRRGSHVHVRARSLALGRAHTEQAH